MKQLLLVLLMFIELLSKAESQSRIPANEAIAHIGEVKEVDGYAYYGEMQNNKVAPYSGKELIYITGVDHQKTDFIIIVKIKNIKKDSILYESLTHKRDLKKISKTEKFDLAATGKIFLYKGKPAITIDEDELHVLEPVD